MNKKDGANCFPTTNKTLQRRRLHSLFFRTGCSKRTVFVVSASGLLCCAQIAFCRCCLATPLLLLLLSWLFLVVVTLVAGKGVVLIKRTATITDAYLRTTGPVWGSISSHSNKMARFLNMLGGRSSGEKGRSSFVAFKIFFS